MRKENYNQLTYENHQTLHKHFQITLNNNLMQGQAEEIRYYKRYIAQGARIDDITSRIERTELVNLLSSICNMYNYRRYFYREALTQKQMRLEYQLTFVYCLEQYHAWSELLLELRRITKKVRV